MSLSTAAQEEVSGGRNGGVSRQQDDDEVLFELKVIPFFGRDVSVILQNANGPCPLLAIANALLLRNQINLPARCLSVGNIHIQQLLSIVAEHMLDANKETKQLQDQQVVPLNESYQMRTETIRQNISDAISILPKLLTGVDVNPKFLHCKGFEFTDEVAIFDLLDISLFHGWLVDPNSEVARVIGQSSYNQLVERIIQWDIQMLEGKREEDKKLAPMGMPASTSASASTSTSTSASSSVSASNTKEAAGDPERERVRVSLNVLHSISTGEEDGDGGGRDLIDPSDNAGVEEKSQRSWVALSLTTKDEQPATTATGSQPSTSKAARNGERTQQMNGERDLYAYQIIQGFLQVSSSQLTTEGLFALQREMKDRELAVFFRNNHFSTIFKYENQLHLLMTDSGYRDLPLCVWEVLTDVAGNTQIVDGKFSSNSQMGHGVNGSDTVATEASHMLSQMGLSDGGAKGMTPVNATRNSAPSPKAIENMYGNQAGQMSDADFALALQMQEEEAIYNEERDRRMQEEQDNLALVRRMQEEEQEHARRRAALQQHQQQQQQQAASGQRQQRSVSTTQKVKDKCSIM